MLQLTEEPEAVRVGILPIFIDLCIWNIAQTENQTVDEAIVQFDPTADISTIFSAEITKIIEQLVTSVCPGEPACSGKGDCQDSVCTCDEGMWLQPTEVTYISLSFTSPQICHANPLR